MTSTPKSDKVPAVVMRRTYTRRSWAKSKDGRDQVVTDRMVEVGPHEYVNETMAEVPRQHLLPEEW